jgi:hypothetical protein
VICDFCDSSTWVFYVCKTFWLRTKIDICRSRSHYVFVYFIIIRFYCFAVTDGYYSYFYNNMVYRIISQKLNVSIIWLLNWVPVRSSKNWIRCQVQAFGDTKRRSYIGGGSRNGFWPDYDTPGDPFALAIGKLFPKRVISGHPLGPIICKTGKVSKADIVFRTSYHLR